MSYVLTAEQLLTLKKWLADNEVVVKNFNRDFSDAVLVAKLLKRFHPRLVHMHNYATRSAVHHKTTNWELLNHKVLSKIAMGQQKAQIEKYATCVPGAIEVFLHQLMTTEEKARAELNKPVNEQENMWTANDDVMVVTVAKQVGDAIIQVPQKMILFSMYEEAVKTIESKEQEVLSTQQRVNHLENMLTLKSLRIEELTTQVSRLQSSGDAKFVAPITPRRQIRYTPHLPSDMDSSSTSHSQSGRSQQK